VYSDNNLVEKIENIIITYITPGFLLLLVQSTQYSLDWVSFTVYPYSEHDIVEFEYLV